MKTYPKIHYTQKEFSHSFPTNKVIVFDKLDGSNIRAEWSKKKGFCKFGTRTRLLDSSSGLLTLAPDLIKSKYGKVLNQIFIEKHCDRAVCFFEFFGLKSFAGSHVIDDQFDVVLFDVQLYKCPMMNAFEFKNTFFRNCQIPKILYEGAYSKFIDDSVRNGTLAGMTFEGVICKGEHNKHKEVIMFKQKNQAWIEKLREIYADDEKQFKDKL